MLCCIVQHSLSVVHPASFIVYRSSSIASLGFLLSIVRLNIVYRLSSIVHRSPFIVHLFVLHSPDYEWTMNAR
jgi:hypothetical protein